MTLSKERFFGLWSEVEGHLRFHEFSGVPISSINQYIGREVDEEIDDKVLNYLKNGIYLSAVRSAGLSIIDGKSLVSCEDCIITDGVWIWVGNVPFYYEKNNLSLPGDFLHNIINNNYTIPVSYRSRQSELRQFLNSEILTQK